MDINILIQQTINGLAIGSVYAIFALGYTLVFSILGIINFAHGAVFTIGAYLTYVFLGRQFSFNGVLANGQLSFNGEPVVIWFPLAVLLAAVLSGFFAVFLERIAFRPLRNRNADSLLSLVSSLGLAIALVNIIQYLVGAETYSYPSISTLFPTTPAIPPAINFGVVGDGPVIIRTAQFIVFGMSMLILAVLTFFINGTRTGKALRAVAEDQTTASLLGINTNRLIVVTFFLSGFIGAIAGSMVALSINITGPYFGINFGLKGLAVIVLGGLGSIPGAVVGGLLIGVGESLIPSNLIGYKDAVAFVLLFLVLLLRPQGILGRAFVQKV
jgi:branched-chain amino acid transport system permease protein